MAQEAVPVGDLPDEIKPLFHNYHPEKIDVERDAEWIILTVLLYGEWHQIEWAFRTYGWNRIEEVVKKDIEGMRTLPYVVANFWSIVFWGRDLPHPTVREKWAITRLPEKRRR